MENNEIQYVQYKFLLILFFINVSENPPSPVPPYPTPPPVKPGKSSIAYVSDVRYRMRGDHTLSKHESLSSTKLRFLVEGQLYWAASECNHLRIDHSAHFSTCC